ncbi:MAG: MFS transporter, partial [Paracoccaceae bacterium]
MWLAPRIERRLGGAALKVAGLVFAATFILPAAAPGPVTFGLALVLLGASSGLTDVVMNARVSALESRHQRPLMNANHGLFSAAYAVSALLAGLARAAGVSPVLVFGGLAVLAAALAISARARNAPAVAPRLHGAAFPLRPVLFCGALALIAFMSEATVEAWSALHIERTLGGGSVQGAMGPALLGLAMAVGRFGGQAVSAHIDEYSLVRWASLLSIVGVLIAATAPVPAVAYLGFAVLGLGVSVIGPVAFALVGRLVPPEKRTDAISRVAVLAFAGFFIAPMLMGLISGGFGLRVAFGSVALLLLVTWPLVGMIRRLDG